MRVAKTIDELVDELPRCTRPVGLVPTMGAIHNGHMELVKRGRFDNATLVVSIFVNPSQFHTTGDLDSYPQGIKTDLLTLKSTGADIVFAPSVEEIYPVGFDTFVDVGDIAKRLEGNSRPNHFRGVATVVCKLLSIIRPDTAYFGQKDAQQMLVVKRLNADLNLGAKIIAVPTVRESDGLALSSRNILLRMEERKAAPVLYKALRLAQKLNTSDVNDIKFQMRSLIEKESLARIDYISVANIYTLEELSQLRKPALVSLAVQIGKIRLIDNVVLQKT